MQPHRPVWRRIFLSASWPDISMRWRACGTATTALVISALLSSRLIETTTISIKIVALVTQQPSAYSALPPLTEDGSHASTGW